MLRLRIVLVFVDRGHLTYLVSRTRCSVLTLPAERDPYLVEEPSYHWPGSAAHHFVLRCVRGTSECTHPNRTYYRLHRSLLIAGHEPLLVRWRGGAVGEGVRHTLPVACR